MDFFFCVNELTLKQLDKINKNVFFSAVGSNTHTVSECAQIGDTEDDG